LVPGAIQSSNRYQLFGCFPSKAPSDEEVHASAIYSNNEVSGAQSCIPSTTMVSVMDAQIDANNSRTARRCVVPRLCNFLDTGTGTTVYRRRGYFCQFQSYHRRFGLTLTVLFGKTAVDPDTAKADA